MLQGTGFYMYYMESGSYMYYWNPILICYIGIRSQTKMEKRRSKSLLRRCLLKRSFKSLNPSQADAFRNRLTGSMIVTSISVLIGIITSSFTRRAVRTGIKPFPYSMESQMLFRMIPQTNVYTI